MPKNKKTNPSDERRPLAVVMGASSGVGYELARQFAKKGFDLLMTAENEDILKAAETLRTPNCTVEGFQTDLAKYEGVEAFCAKMGSMGRPVEAIAINAEVAVSGDFARETSLKDELRLIRLNVISTVHLSKRIVEDMVARGKGRLLFTSPIAAATPGPFMAVYNASNAFIRSFAQALREELRGSGVTVTLLMPGAAESMFAKRAHIHIRDDAKEVAEQGFEALMARAYRMQTERKLKRQA